MTAPDVAARTAANEALFAPVGTTSAKDQCTVCGATGYPWGSWKDTHRRGHAPAPCCGKPLSVLMNGQPRAHSRAPIGCTKRGAA